MARYGKDDYRRTARGCSMAVRLAGKGVRMTRAYYAKGGPWDARGGILAHKINAKNADRPFAEVVVGATGLEPVTLSFEG